MAVYILEKAWNSSKDVVASVLEAKTDSCGGMRVKFILQVFFLQNFCMLKMKEMDGLPREWWFLLLGAWWYGEQVAEVVRMANVIVAVGLWVEPEWIPRHSTARKQGVASGWSWCHQDRPCILFRQVCTWGCNGLHGMEVYPPSSPATTYG